MTDRNKPHTEFLEAVMNASRAALPEGGRCVKVNNGAAAIEGRYISFGVTGITDLMILYGENSRALFIEIKTGHGSLRPSQKLFQMTCYRANMLHLVARAESPAIIPQATALVLQWVREHGASPCSQPTTWQLRNLTLSQWTPTEVMTTLPVQGTRAGSVKSPPEKTHS